MKTKVLILMMALLWITQYVPDTYAYSSVPVAIQTISGYSGFGMEVSNNLTYVTFEDDVNIDIRYVDNLSRIIVRYKTLHDKFTVTYGTTSNIIITVENFDYIEIDTLRARDGYLTVRSESVSHDIVFDPSNRMFFSGTTDYELASNDMQFISDIDNPIDMDDINELFLAWDNYDGNVTENIVVYEDQYSGNEDIIGDYGVILMASDSSQNKSYLSYTISVRDMTSPTIAPLNVIHVSYKDVYSVNQIISNLEVYDNVSDMDNIEITVISNSYDINKTKLGSYQIVLQATDASGNSSTAVQVIHVIDDVPPIISGINNYTISVDDRLTMADILANLTVFDEKDSLPINLVVQSSNYSENQKGEFSIVVSATDQSGNVGTYHVTIQVTDLIPPVFYINLSQITTTVLTVFNETQLLSMISDQIPFSYESLSITLNEYLNNENKPGIYRIHLSAKNGSQVTNLQTLIRVNEAIESTITEEVIWYAQPWFITSVSVVTLMISFGIVYFIKKKRG